jgi:hypothetical protein
LQSRQSISGQFSFGRFGGVAGASAQRPKCMGSWPAWVSAPAHTGATAARRKAARLAHRAQPLPCRTLRCRQLAR